MDKTEYIRKMYSILLPMCGKYGFYDVAAGMIAQSIQEGWNSGLATKYFNYWGMKAGTSFKGPTVAMDNKQKTDPAIYRTYTSIEHGCEGYFEFLSYPRYRKLKNCKTDIEFLDNIGPCGWNSNPGYGDRCRRHLTEVYQAIMNVGFPFTWYVGGTYTTQQDLNVRTAPSGDLLEFDKLTDNAKEHAFSTPGGTAILRRGTRVTVKEIIKEGSMVWLRIPSGWICGKNSKNIFVY